MSPKVIVSVGKNDVMAATVPTSLNQKTINIRKAGFRSDRKHTDYGQEQENHTQDGVKIKTVVKKAPTTAQRQSQKILKGPLEE